MGDAATMAGFFFGVLGVIGAEGTVVVFLFLVASFFLVGEAGGTGILVLFLTGDLGDGGTMGVFCFVKAGDADAGGGAGVGAGGAYLCGAGGGASPLGLESGSADGSVGGGTYWLFFLIVATCGNGGGGVYFVGVVFFHAGACFGATGTSSALGVVVVNGGSANGAALGTGFSFLVLILVFCTS